MGSFLTALANVGSQYAQGRTEAQEERQARAFREAQIAREQKQLSLEEINQKLAQQRFELEKKAYQEPRMIKIPGQRALFWLPDKGHFASEQELKDLGIGPVDEGTAAAKFVQGWVNRQDPAIKDELTARAVADFGAYASSGQDPDVPKILSGLQSYAKSEEDKKIALQNRREDQQRAQREAAQRWSEHRAEMEGFQRSMVPYRAQEKNQYMNPAERQQYDTLNTVNRSVDRLTKFIESHNLQNDNAWVFGDHSALVNHLRMKGYTFGVAPDAISRELIKDAGFISTIGAAQWTRMLGRSRYTYDDIRVHLPLPTDTPQQLYTKMQWYRDGPLLDVRSSLTGLIPPGQSTPLPSPDFDLPDSANPLPPGSQVAIPTPVTSGAADRTAAPRQLGTTDPNNPLGLNLPQQ
jgi:hypothetical protein